MKTTKIKEEIEYFGDIISNWKQEHKNKYVITGLQQGGTNVDKRIGRVVQVRIEAGHLGSDNVLLRHVDNILRQHTNQFFWLVPDKFTKYLDKCFKGVYLDDSDTITYTLNEGSDGEKGFIVASKIKDSESTPMRNIKAAINNKIEEIRSY
ncbi:hypothetical protein [Tenacibaculum maritimum]|uniref:hypothetical protein n=2 Tax=Tenacibaculum maritimum TaxID=107401 RepID=UPI0038900907